MDVKKYFLYLKSCDEQCECKIIKDINNKVGIVNNRAISSQYVKNELKEYLFL